MTEEKNDKGLTKLTRLSLLRIDGVDAQEFLQGQITLDAKLIDATPRLCAYCDAKGRVLATLILFKKDATYFALISSNLSEKIAKRLRLYTLRRKVTVDVDTRFTVYGSLENNVNENDAIALNLSFASIVIKSEMIESTFEETLWWEKAVRTKFPWVESSTAGLFIPQSIGLDSWKAITYGKGCYVGQEVISRIHSLGAPSRIAALYQGFSEEFKAGLALYDSRKEAVATLIYGLKGLALCECAIKEVSASLYLEDGTHLTKID